jgi:hypothetical protein
MPPAIAAPAVLAPTPVITAPVVTIIVPAIAAAAVLAPAAPSPLPKRFIMPPPRPILPPSALGSSAVRRVMSWLSF